MRALRPWEVATKDSRIWVEECSIMVAAEEATCAVTVIREAWAGSTTKAMVERRITTWEEET